MSLSPDTVDHLNLKIFANGNPSLDLEPAIPMFHRWIQDSVLDELLVDIADYRHVPAGPGIMLIGHQSNYSLDLAFSRLGLLYNRKLPTQGTLDDKLQSAFASALAACALVEQEPAFHGKLQFNAGDCEISFNDRLLAPNTEETWLAIQPSIFGFLDHVFGKQPYTVERTGDPRERLRLALRTSRFIPVSTLIENGTLSFSNQ